jgi:N4-gp56 family major capsid protein
MATKSYSTSDNEAAKLWAKELEHETIQRTFLGKFLGTGNTSCFQERKELTKSAGDRLTTTLRANLVGDGISSDGQVEGNEEALQTFTDQFYIDSLDHAVSTPTKGTISAQRVPFDVGAEAKDALSDWWAVRLDTCAANHLAGNTAAVDNRYIGFNATVAPSTGRIVRPSTITADQSLTSSHKFTLSLIDKAVTRIKTLDSSNNYRIRPVRVAGYAKPVWVLFVHPHQMHDLRTDASTAGNFFDLFKANLMGGQYPDNPIFTAAEFMYNNVVVHEWESIPLGCDGSTPTTAVADTRRAVLCGAQALQVGFGQGFEGMSMSWVQEYFNYKKVLGTDSHLIFGMKKAQYNSKDFATCVISTYAAEP